MHIVKPNLTPQTADAPTATIATMIETRVVMVLDADHCLLSSGRQATRAVSCLVEPLAGDVVLVAQSEASCHVLHVLDRCGVHVAIAISAPGDKEMCLRGSKLSMHALETIDLMSARDLNFTAATGNLSLNARNLFATVSESFVQQSRHFIGKAGQYLLDVRHLLKLHGQDALITAERDIKADAERISMG
jgi:hypothetical protein